MSDCRCVSMLRLSRVAVEECGVSSPPPVAFLGVCDNMRLNRRHGLDLWHWDLLGLRSEVVTPIVPFDLASLRFAFAFFNPLENDSFKIRLVSPSGTVVGDFNLSLSEGTRDEEGRTWAGEGGGVVVGGHGPWFVNRVDLPTPSFVVTESGRYGIETVLDDGSTQEVGSLYILTFVAKPLSPSRIAAIEADPHAARKVGLDIRCNECGDSMRFVASIRGETDVEADEVWYESAPDRFKCGCGATSIDCTSIKQGLHGLLGAHASGPQGALKSFEPIYRRSTLQTIHTELAELLESHTEEGVFQRFFERNPVLLWQFAAERLMPQVPILTRHKADFVLLTPSRELVLIEIERPNLQLMKKDGHVAAQLQHAFEQTGDWLHALEDHKAAVLDAMNLKPEDVATVRAVVIAGRNTRYKASDLRRLKARPRGPISVLTYDDIADSLGALIQEMEQL